MSKTWLIDSVWENFLLCIPKTTKYLKSTILTVSHRMFLFLIKEIKTNLWVAILFVVVEDGGGGDWEKMKASSYVFVVFVEDGGLKKKAGDMVSVKVLDGVWMDKPKLTKWFNLNFIQW